MTFRIQNQIRQNATEIRSYIDDLFSWEEEINNKSNKKPAKSSSNSKQNKENFPIRGEALEDQSHQEDEEERKLTETKSSNEDVKRSDEANKVLKRDGASIPDYYKAWDQFTKNVDKELEKEEPEVPKKEKEKKPQQPVNPMQRTSGAEINTKIVIKGGRSSYNEVESLKEKGNLYFKSLEFDKAIEMYTESIKKGLVQQVNDELMVILYSNRAMAYLKLRENLKAEEDCNCALKLNDKHVKSLVRRGQARRRLEKYKGALADFEAAGQVEPDNKEIRDEIKGIKKKIETIKEEQKKKMILPISITQNPKISVKVDDFDPDKVVELEEAQGQKGDSIKTDSVENYANQTSSTQPSGTANVTSEFLGLKDVEGKLVKHDTKEVEEEAIKQKVHFRLDLNVQESTQKTHYEPVSLQKNPKKSAIKQKYQFSPNTEVEKPKAKETKITDEKTLKAVMKGKEMWQKKVIEEYEKVSTTNSHEKPKEEVKTIINITNSSEFLTSWKHIKDSEEACEKLLLSQAKPERFGEIFVAGIDFDLFMELIKFGSKILERNNKLPLEILDGLGKIKRFDINVKSMLASEKKVVKEILNKTKEKVTDIGSKIEEISKIYKI